MRIMGTLLQKIRTIRPTRRKLLQLYFALLFNANLKGFSNGTLYQGSSKQVCVPGLNCYSCPGAVGACPLGSLQGAFAAGRPTIFYVGGILLLYGILLGRTICGWLCPFGLIQELLFKIPTPKLKKGPLTRTLSMLKYVLLAVFVFLVPIAYALKDIPLPAFCKFLCPAGTLEGGLVLLANEVNASWFSMLGGIFTWKFMLTVSILTGCVFIFRLFCRFLCPLGALYGLLNRFSFLGIQLDESKCTACGRCTALCQVDIRQVGDRECVSCGECVNICPTKAISWKGGKILLKINEIALGQTQNAAQAIRRQRKLQTVTRSVTATLMLLLLAFALFQFSWNDGNTLHQGSEIGDLSISQPLAILSDIGTAELTIDPGRTGKLTIVNFWGTWCTPCIQELPYFDRIAREYGDSIAIVAVHTPLSGETAPAYIKKYHPSSPLIFALDQPLDETGLMGSYYTALGGRGTYPYTVVLDENGIILERIVSTLEYEDLVKIVNTYLAE